MSLCEVWGGSNSFMAGKKLVSTLRWEIPPKRDIASCLGSFGVTKVGLNMFLCGYGLTDLDLRFASLTACFILRVPSFPLNSAMTRRVVFGILFLESLFWRSLLSSLVHICFPNLVPLHAKWTGFEASFSSVSVSFWLDVELFLKMEFECC